MDDACRWKSLKLNSCTVASRLFLPRLLLLHGYFDSYVMHKTLTWAVRGKATTLKIRTHVAVIRYGLHACTAHGLRSTHCSILERNLGEMEQHNIRKVSWYDNNVVTVLFLHVLRYRLTPHTISSPACDFPDHTHSSHLIKSMITPIPPRNIPVALTTPHLKLSQICS